RWRGRRHRSWVLRRPSPLGLTQDLADGSPGPTFTACGPCRRRRRRTKYSRGRTSQIPWLQTPAVERKRGTRSWLRPTQTCGAEIGMTRFTRHLLAVVVLAGATSASAQPLEPIVYTVRVPNPAKSEAQVEALVPTEGQRAIELMMPVWTPGYYRV